MLRKPSISTAGSTTRTPTPVARAMRRASNGAPATSAQAHAYEKLPAAAPTVSKRANLAPTGASATAMPTAAGGSPSASVRQKFAP